jgi:hypothetical protein
MINKSLLFPNKFKYLGWILFIPGIIFSIIRFYYGIKLSFLDLKLFAIYSSYFETKIFTVVENNLTEETAGVLILTGLLILIFTKEQDEDDTIQLIRLRSFMLSIFINTILLFIAMITVFGIAFIQVMTFNLISTPIIYLIIFKYSVYKYRRKLKE